MLRPGRVGEIPAETTRIAKAAFPKGNTIMSLRDVFGSLYKDEDFAALFPKLGQPALAPWRLALVTVFQFLENLTDRQAADAVRGRLDWKYALGLELEDSGFDFSVLSEFRSRLMAGNAEQLLLDKMLAQFTEAGLVKTRGKQRTDSTHVVANIRLMNRTELVGETLRAALNELATVNPGWLRHFAPEAWFARYGKPVGEYRLPKGKTARETYQLQVGEDGFRLLDALDSNPDLVELQALPKVLSLRQVWERHYERSGQSVRWRDGPELSRAALATESPYDPEAKYSTKRDTTWTGYKVHITESCDEDKPHLILNVLTTPATQQDVSSTATIHQALSDKQRLPAHHLVDAGYIDSELLVQSPEAYQVTLIGPPRSMKGWQSKQEDAFTPYSFEIDWERQLACCPGGKTSSYWKPYRRNGRYPQDFIAVRFRQADCRHCSLRARCVRSATRGRMLHLQPKETFLALRAAREYIATDDGQHAYALRAGIEGTLSEGVRAFGLRRSRYRGEAKTHFQHLATAAAVNALRAVDWLRGKRPQTTRRTRFAALAKAA